MDVSPSFLGYQGILSVSPRTHFLCSMTIQQNTQGTTCSPGPLLMLRANKVQTALLAVTLLIDGCTSARKREFNVHILRILLILKSLLVLAFDTHIL